jgi:hypothetical protein
VEFWNTRAIRPVTTVDMPMLLLPAEGVNAWQGFAAQLEALLARPAEFTPDVLLVSRALPQADLEKFAASLGLERSTEGPRTGTRSPTPPRRQPPFAFLTGADPVGLVSFERDYGLTASFDAQVFAGTTTARFSSPVHFHASGGTLVRISGAPLDRLPKRDCLAQAASMETRQAPQVTLRRELLDRLLIVNGHHLRLVLTDYLQHYNMGRPHRSLGQLTPAQAHTRPAEPVNLAEHQVRRKQVLSGLTHEYYIAA